MGERGADAIIAVFREAIDQAQKRLLQSLQKETERCEAFANECLREMEEVLAPYQHLVDPLIRISGVQRVSALRILPELAASPETFPTVRHFSSWIGICPGNNESAGKRVNGRVLEGNSHLKTCLIEVGQAVGLMKVQETEVRKSFQTVRARRGHRKAVMAIGHRIARTICALCRTAYVC